ncbi:hypothetical protein [Amycolatopsis jiangsuensis]|uniref:Uncharacterized protein n=1 Tax=Amycolatopsis jiangsuensis TaxID=1181879 RepID=A0A840IUG8_9PSEU|nr:hypothetical protein [Amycolatopsis jiangsuensis]MBB4685159.1 hypothetical protein [Amycolatopsis jiangsuensis]
MDLTPEPESLDELIADCAHLPSALHAPRTAAVAGRLPTPRSPRPWTVDDACHAQVADLDAYV